MRICQVSAGLVPLTSSKADATNRIILGLSTQMALLGHEVDVFSYGCEETEGLPFSVSNLTLPIALRNSAATREIAFGLAAARRLASNRGIRGYDIVHFHAPISAVLGSLSARGTNTPSVYTNGNPNLAVEFSAIHGPFRRLRMAKSLNTSHLPILNAVGSVYFESLAFNRCNKTIAVSQTLRSGIIDHFGVSEKKVVSIPNGVDLNQYRPDPPDPQILARHDLEGKRIVLCLARIAPYKNQLCLVKAIPKIVKQVPEAQFLFVGPIEKPFLSYYEELVHVAKSLGVERNCMFTGEVDASLLPKYYSIADVFVLASISEGLPLVLLEAMSSGKPIVASRIPQSQELAINGNEMVFAESDDSNQFAREILILLANSGKAKEMGSNARRTAEAQFSWPSVAKRTLDLYDSLLREVGS